MSRKNRFFVLLAAFFSLSASAGEPLITVFYTQRDGVDSDACKFYRAKLYGTSDANTRDRTLIEINSDSKFEQLVQAAKTAAKDPGVMEEVRKIETKRPAKPGKVAFILSKNEGNYGSTSYGMRIGFILAGQHARSLPVWHVECLGKTETGGYRYRESPFPFQNSHLNWTDVTGTAGADVYAGLYETVGEADMTKLETIRERLGSLYKKIPLDDPDISRVR